MHVNFQLCAVKWEIRIIQIRGNPKNRSISNLLPGKFGWPFEVISREINISAAFVNWPLHADYQSVWLRCFVKV